ncbi:MAG: helix-turn-helix transcriptional regulator [Oscillospiraceae bacterium]|nr:helix-turn-helix transcriptional regulator [Oscillospiraceae bacterium]
MIQCLAYWVRLLTITSLCAASRATLQKLRQGEPVSWENISTICALLNCQPGDIMEYVPDEEKS